MVADRPGEVPAPERVGPALQLGRVGLAALDHDELTELVLDAWRMVVPKRVARERLGEE